MKKQTIAVIFGGQSSEHDISCLSVANILPAVNRERYEPVIVGITKDGKWLLVESVEQIRDGSWRNSTKRAVLSPDAEEKCFYVTEGESITRIPVDVIFPVLHGLYGEDGTIQGLFELARIPYVGCGVLSSAVTMDKFFTKLIVKTLGIRQASYVPVLKRELEDMKAVIERVEAALPYPVFIKPSRAGSSKGVSKARNARELEAGLLLAAENDSKILVEEEIRGRELECAVLGGQEPKASGVGEILSAADFYDFDAKYLNADSRTVIKPDLPEGREEEIRADALKIFRAVDGKGLSRVDFFLDEKGVVFNEINTIPGFTSISMYPMLWEERGIDSKELIQMLIDTAYTRNTD